MTLRRNAITGTPALQWLLLLAMLFAPLQGAMSAFGNNCHCDMMMKMAEVVGDVAQAAVATHVAAKKCCCKDCCDQQACASGCTVAHGGYLMVGFVPSVLINPLQPLQAQPLEPLVGQPVSPLLRPPQI